MKKNVLALSIAAMIGGLGLAGGASADVIPGATKMTPSNASKFSVSEGGVGHILLVPYFTAQDGNMSVIHITNTDQTNGKVVKVRFRGAANSDDILDFTLLLSPGDVWTGAVTAGADGVAQLATADKSCTYPAIPSGGVSFVTSRLTAANMDVASNTREGYIEILNTADIPGPSVTGTATALYTATKHVNGVPPCTQSVLDANFLNNNYTTESAAAAAGFDTPSGGLAGDWYIINVPKTTTFSGVTTTVKATDNNGTSANANFVVFPQSAAAVNDGSNTTLAVNYTADPLMADAVQGVAPATTFAAVTPAIRAGFYDLPDLSTPYVVAPGTIAIGDTNSVPAPVDQAAALTNAIAVTSIYNQYAVEPGISAQTDWVFSMPTRRYEVAVNYSGNQRVFSPAPSSLSVARFTSSNTFMSNVVPYEVCVNADGQSFFDREETGKTNSAVFSPSQLQSYSFCGETSVLSFGTGKVLGAQVAASSVTPGFLNGWGIMNTQNGPGKQGLPIIGASFIKLVNGAAQPGVSGTYGISFPHRYTK
ncbi:cell surface protein [Extensimonas sp. H3M7-6]|uniref:cell surface protein n=1 Tax=Extensimonas soli TaxID=3031322 RepID=UPI0023DB459B|nr:cell surface protein [Extensimonas sp. H3M7-6]MDF1482632.1 cell surface protein [Extensimonas sp. H3M7-6]